MRPTRRTFLKDAWWGSVALLSAAACARSDAGRTSAPLPPRPLGVALLGLGKYSTEQLAPALQKTRFCELRGIVTGSPEKIPVWQERYRIPDRNVYDYASLSRIADNPDIDIVYVVVPTGLHAKYTLLSAQAGKHVWCEKPMAMNVAECEQMIAACRDRGVKLAIGYRMQHEPNTRTVMSYARSLPFGPIREVRALAGYHGGGEPGWRLERSMGGGALYDMGVYCINAARYATGEEPIAVTRAVQSTTRPEIFREVDETTEFELRFPSGVTAYGRTSVGEDINQLRVDCDKGWYELAPMQRYSGVTGRRSDGLLLDLTIDNQQAKQMDDDALALIEGRPLMVPGEEGLRDIRIVQAIREAAATEAAVELAS